MAESLEAQTILEEVPLPRGPATGDGMLPQIVPGEVTFHPGDIEDNDIQGEATHQWKAAKSLDGITIEEGTITYQDIVLQVGDHSFAEPTEEWDVWCKITLLPSGEPTEGLIEDGPLAIGPPADTEEFKYRRLAEIYNGHWEAPGAFYGKIRQLQFEPIRLGEIGGGSTLLRPFKLSVSGVPFEIAVAEGEVHSRVMFGTDSIATVIAATRTVANGDVVYVEIYRDTGTREVLSADTLSADALPVGSSEYQYVEVGRVSVTDEGVVTFIQHQFQNIDVFEDLCVANGVFALVPLAMSGVDTYSP